MVSADQVKQLREKTGLSVIECKQALEEAQGDETKAMEILNSKSQEKAEKKSEREAGQGLIEPYVHNNGKVGVLLQLHCETDFVASNEEFKAVAHDLAMQVVAMNPENEEELLAQPFIKDQDKTVQEVIHGLVGKLGENIKLGKFVRLEI